MGVNLTPIAVKETIALDRLAGRTLAVDAAIELYQFLSIMRLPDGALLSDGKGHVTSHLNGILFRSTRLISEHRARLLYVFDGPPPALKRTEIEKRRAAKAKAEREYADAVARGDR
ncbi:MAG TPA: flap structure-specific endonuclease, partial [Thermoplasmata archaeon]|nr:flap structure-specific endonuclease [Thermoplasmata archaeon]